MRVIHGVILLGALGAGCNDPGPSPAPPPLAAASPASSQSAAVSPQVVPCADAAQPPIALVEIKLAPGASAGQCVRSDPSPNPVYVCDYTKAIKWTFINTCSKAVPAAIGERKSADGNNPDDPLAAAANLPSDPDPVPPSAGTAGSATVKADVSAARNDCYKYQIVIDGVNTDPEIEVRRGTGLKKECSSISPVPIATPAGAKR